MRASLAEGDPDIPTLADRAWQAVYWLGYRAARAWWRMRRPDQHGAIVAVWLDGRILAVRQSYKHGLTFPGGTIHSGEAPLAAAQRELREELGLAVPAQALTLAYETTMEWEFRQDHVRIFELHLDHAPALAIDNREIVAARFMRPEEMLASAMPPFIRTYLLEGRRP